MTTLKGPWQSGPAELLRYALTQLHRQSDFDHRIAFLLLDVGVETLFKTYLLLPDKVTGAATKYFDRKAAAEGNFHELVRGVENAAGPKLAALDLTHVQFYHDLRNKLYHQGNGITIPLEQIKGYARLATDLLRALLDVDLADELQRPELEAKLMVEQREQAEKEEGEIAARKEAIEAVRRRLETLAAEAVERVWPALALRGFERRFVEIVNECREKYKVGQDCHFDEQISELLGSYSAGAPVTLTNVSDDLTELRLGVVVAHLSLDETVDIPNHSWAGLYKLAEMYPGVERQPTLLYDEQRKIVGSTEPSHAQVVAAGMEWESILGGICATITSWLGRQQEPRDKN